MSLVDILRLLIIFQGAVSIGLATVIFYHYTRIFTGQKGILPLHVALVSISHVALALYALQDVYFRLGNHFTWRVPIVFLAMLISDLSLWILSQHTRTRYRVMHRLKRSEQEALTKKKTIR